MKDKVTGNDSNISPNGLLLFCFPSPPLTVLLLLALAGTD